MGELETYELVNFFPFSPAVLLRLYERLVLESWLGGAVGLIASLGWFVATAAGRHRVVAGLLALSAASTGVLFFHMEYAQLNWAGTYAAYAFWAQSLALAAYVWLGTTAPRVESSAKTTVAVGLTLLTSLAVWLAGADAWPVLEALGVTPDITAIAILVFLASRSGPVLPRLALAVVPILWLIASFLTWTALDQIYGFVLPGVGLATAAALLVSQMARQIAR